MAVEESPEELIRRLGWASGFLTDHERKYQIGLGCECAKEVLLRGAHDLVKAAGGGGPW